MKYEESGKFFVGEMDTAKAMKNGIEKFVLEAYRLLCLYGESYVRPLIWITGMILFFALYRTLAPHTIRKNNTNISHSQKIIDEIMYSIAVFFQLIQKK